MAISTFMGLETNKRGLTAQQTSLYTVGNNISNANTVGYTRQRVNLTPTTGFPSAGMNAPMMAGHLGTGVTSESITRIRDQFVDKQYRQETNTLGYWSQQTNAISQMEDIMSEPSEYGLNAAFDEFYTAWQTLANSPTSAAARQVVYTKASHLASSFNYMSTQMTQVQTNLKAEATNTVNNINSILEEIASLNNQIKQVEPNGYIPNELYDARDLLLDELSQYVPVSIEKVESGGLATSAAEGALKVSLDLANGTKQVLVSADPSSKSAAMKLSLLTGTVNATDGTVTYSSLSGDNFEAIAGISFENTTANKMTVETNTDAVTNATDGVKLTLDTTTVIVKADGTVLDGTGAALLDASGNAITVDANDKIQLPTGEVISLNKDATGTITAASLSTSTSQIISINDMITQKGELVSYANSYGYLANVVPLTDNSTTPPTTMYVADIQGFISNKLNDLDRLANQFATSFNNLHKAGYGLSSNGIAPSPTGLAFFDETQVITAGNIKVNDNMATFSNIAASTQNNEEGNGNMALTLSNLRTTSLAGLEDTSAAKFYESMVADVGTAGEKAVRMEYNSTTIQLTISNNRDSITSVSLDEEMTDMIRFQQAYNASARMMTTIDETLDKIVNGMGRVGL